MATFTKGEVIIILDDPSTSMNVLKTIGKRLRVEDSDLRAVLVARIKAKLPKKDDEPTQILESDIGVNPPEPPVRTETRARAEEPEEAPRREPHRREMPDIPENVDQTLFQKIRKAVRNFVGDDLAQAIGIAVSLGIDVWQNRMAEKNKKDLQALLDQQKKEIYGDIANMMEAIMSPDKADDLKVAEALKGKAVRLGNALKAAAESGPAFSLNSLLSGGDKHEKGEKKEEKPQGHKVRII